MNKKDIRRELINKRRNLKAENVLEKSNAIFHKFIGTREFRISRTIMFYVSKDNEVSTASIIEYAIKKGKNVCVPKVDIHKHILHPVGIRDINRELEKGHFGVREPVFDAKKIVPVKEIGLIVVPGTAFDANGHRLGWGKGYYDKFLEHAGKTHKIGLAFDFQVLNELPMDKHDVPVDMVITEKRKIISKFRRRRRTEDLL